ncbi:hypothetical protein LVD17_14555 [Fulvivirga ulvae]|uniref:hypothetical protein n=1 Tax=Fulvivirga ulvae TaxID=2904245 RepID=UPI001F26F75F|nr:hypothetical protein [Fulvivirga ulvae]UII35028.1 hypothetical protein LVD17_14555 [Fulvivirga ulvae]
MNKLHFKIYLLLFMAVISTACSDDDDTAASPDKKAMEELTGEWRAAKVTKDDFELAGFENFRLVITQGKIFQTHGDSELIFPIGEFEFVENSNYEKVVCQGVEVRLAYDEGGLVASFTLAKEPSGGRQAGLNGGYVFDMVSN